MISRVVAIIFFLMIRRPPRSTLDRSSAASDVYKRQGEWHKDLQITEERQDKQKHKNTTKKYAHTLVLLAQIGLRPFPNRPVSYTHLRAHETVLDLVCRLLIEKKKTKKKKKTILQKKKQIINQYRYARY